MATPTGADTASRPARFTTNRHLLTRRIGDGLLVCLPDAGLDRGGDVVELNAASRALLQACQSACTLDEVVATLALQHRVHPETIRADVALSLANAVERGLVVCTT